MAFDPDAYLQEKQAFDPDAYLKGRDAPAPVDDGRRGADLIPGAAPGTQAPASTAPVQPPRDTSFTGKLKGAVEAALSVVSNALPTAAFGAAAGGWQHVAESGANRVRGAFGAAPLPTTAPSLEEATSKGAERVTYQPRTREGQEMAAPVNEAIGTAGTALMAGPRGMTGMGGRTAAEAAGIRPAARLAGDVAAAANDRAKGATARGLGRMLDVNPEKVKAAGAAEAQGLTVLPHHVSDQTATQKIGQATQHVPLAGGQVKRNQKAFTKAVIKQINPEDKASQLTPEVMDRALKRAGGQIGDNMSAVEVPQETLAPKLEGIRKSLGVESDETGRIVSNYLGQLDSLAAENGGKIPGIALRKLDSEIGAKMRAMGTDKGDLLGQLDKLQDAIRDSAQAHMTPEQAAQTKTARTQYAKTMSLVPAAKDIATTGYLPPSKLLDLATNNKAGKYLLASGKGGEWHDLAKAGALVADPEGHLRLTAGTSVGVGAGSVVAYTNPAAAAGAAVGAVGLSRVYNHLGPKLVRRLAKEYDRKAAAEAPPPKAPPPEPMLTEGASGPQDNSPGPGGSKVLDAPAVEFPLELAPEAAGSKPLEVVPTEGLHAAVGDDMPPARLNPAPRPNRAEQIPAVPGRPDMPEVMVAGDLGDAAKQGRAPGEVGRDAPTGEAMQSDNAALARQSELQRRYGSAGGKLEPSVDQIPAGEATEIKPEKATPAGSPPDAIDPRLARIDELRSRTDSKAVHAALDKRAADVKKQIKAEAAAAKREADVAELEDAASKTDDPELRQTLLAEANKLRAEKPPAGDVKEGQPPLPVEKPGKIPVGQAKEVEAAEVTGEAVEPLPVGEATELQPEVVEPAPGPLAGPSVGPLAGPGQAEARDFVRRALESTKKFYKLSDLGDLERTIAEGTSFSLLGGSEADAHRFVRGDNVRATLKQIQEQAKGIEDLAARDPDAFRAGVERADAFGGLKALDDPVGEIRRQIELAAGEAGPAQKYKPLVRRKPPVGEVTELQPEVVEPAPAANEPPTQALVPEATTVENAAPETKKVKRMIEPKTEAPAEKGPFKYGDANREAKRLSEETGQKHVATERERVDDEGYTVAEWFVAPEKPPEPKRGMTLEEAKAHVAQANIDRPLGRSWDDIDRMQGGRGLNMKGLEPTPPKRMLEPKTETFEELSARMKATPTAERSAEDMGRYWDMHRERGLAEETKAAAEREAAKTARAKETKGMTLAQIKAHDYLQQEVVHDGKPMARAAWVEKQLEAGAEPSVELVDKVKPMSRMAHFRASNAEQRAHEAKVKAGGKVPEYFLGDFKVSKTEHEYAVRKRGEAPTETPDTPQQRAARVVQQSVVKRTNANSAQVWQIVTPDGGVLSGPPGTYPGRGMLAGTRTTGEQGWKTKREAEAALAALNARAAEVLGTSGKTGAPTTAKTQPTKD